MTGPDDGVVRVATVEFATILCTLAGDLVEGTFHVRTSARQVVESAEELSDAYEFASRSGPPDSDDTTAVTAALVQLVDDARRHAAVVETFGAAAGVLAEGLQRVRKALA